MPAVLRVPRIGGLLGQTLQSRWFILVKDQRQRCEFRHKSFCLENVRQAGGSPDVSDNQAAAAALSAGCRSIRTKPFIAAMRKISNVEQTISSVDTWPSGRSDGTSFSKAETL